MGERSVSAIAQDSQGQFLFGYWEKGNPTIKRKISCQSIKLIYHQASSFQTIFVDHTDIEKKHFSLANSIGAVIFGRNDEVWFHLSSRNFSDNNKGFARWHPEDGLKFYGIDNGLIDDRVTDLLLDLMAICGWLRRAVLPVLMATPSALSRLKTVCLSTASIACTRIGKATSISAQTEGVVHYDGQIFQIIKSPHIGPVLQILEDRDGAFWFGYSPKHRGALPPAANSAQGSPASSCRRSDYENPQEVIVSTTDQQVTFEYKGLSFSTQPRDMLYVYRLKGYDPGLAARDPKDAGLLSELATRRVISGQGCRSRPQLLRDGAGSNISRTRSRIEALTAALNSQEGNEFIGQSKALQQFKSSLERWHPLI